MDLRAHKILSKNTWSEIIVKGKTLEESLLIQMVWRKTISCLSVYTKVNKKEKKISFQDKEFRQQRRKFSQKCSETPEDFFKKMPTKASSNRKRPIFHFLMPILTVVLQVWHDTKMSHHETEIRITMQKLVN